MLSTKKHIYTQGLTSLAILGILAAAIGLSLLIGNVSAQDCPSGYIWSTRSISCIQENCNEIADAHYSYVLDCVCGSSGSINENPADPNRECAYPSDYSACPGCVYACVGLDETCPGEETTSTTTTTELVTTTTMEAPFKFGVYEVDGILFITSPPGEKLIITRSDLPVWARDQIVTVGAMISAVGPPDTVRTGDYNVILDGRAIARIGDQTATGGNIVEGSATIFINGEPAAYVGAYAINPMVTGLVPRVGGVILTNSGCPDIECVKYNNLEPITTLEDKAIKGLTRLAADGEGFEIGDAVVIGNGGADDDSETARVADKGSIILDRPLTRDYPAGTLITRIPAEYADKVPPPPSGRTAAGSVDRSAPNTLDVDSSSESNSSLLVGLALFFVLFIAFFKLSGKIPLKKGLIIIVILLVIIGAWAALKGSGDKTPEGSILVQGPADITPTTSTTLKIVISKSTAPPETVLLQTTSTTFSPASTLEIETTTSTSTTLFKLTTTTSTSSTTTSTISTTTTTTLNIVKPDFEIIDQKEVVNVEEKLWISGRIKNNQAVEVYKVRAVLKIYNPAGKQLQIINSISIDIIAPDETVAFNTIKSDVVTSAIGRYELTVSAE